jgi:hypothetical protein
VAGFSKFHNSFGLVVTDKYGTSTDTKTPTFVQEEQMELKTNNSLPFEKTTETFYIASNR